METIKFYKDSVTDLYVLGNRKSVPAGVCILESNESGSYINIIFTNGVPAESGEISDFVKENGDPYSSLSEIFSALKDFFVKAPAGGGGVEIVNDLTTGGATAALSAEQGKILQDSKMRKLQNGSGSFANISNTLSDLVGLGFDLSNADLSNANLNGANLNGASLEYANLSGTTLNSANLNVANLYRANLNYASLEYANLLCVDLSCASLYSANLNGASLEYANFNNANLSGASLSDANLYGMSLSGAYFLGANGLNSNINEALENVNKNPNGDGLSWTVTWIDGLDYSCNPLTGLFTLGS